MKSKRALSGLRLLLSAAAGGLAFGSPSAFAGSCFEDVGCPGDHYISKGQLRQLGCEPLWTLRNSIYRDNGYCFKTARALAAFSNEGCIYWDQADVPLNDYERANISRIVGVEKENGCR